MEPLKQAYDLELTDKDHGQGWAFGRPVGITTDQWPRSRINGLPMAHLWTILVPEAYRVKGKDLVGISFFQADDAFEDRVGGVEDMITNLTEMNNIDAEDFWASLSNYANHRHRQETYLEDIIGGGWALIWLTEAEFSGGSTPMPNKENTICLSYEVEEWSSTCFVKDAPAQFIQHVVRIDDPNVGKMLDEWPDEGDENTYIPMFSEKGEILKLDRFHAKSHFGGTANPIQGMPEFSPFYIEFEEEFGDANMGGGNGQIDLLNDQFDWACG
ncbi:hypothetical protein [Psychrobacter sp. W2-37-MNA-CIBAN-0211]|uniref:hypothetical protein n=1 Tax=Psychrobacter sp. W2-37-MNA-CIBAN-0211 TaxID=3140443 RepID=UPI0033221A0D